MTRSTNPLIIIIIIIIIIMCVCVLAVGTLNTCSETNTYLYEMIHFMKLDENIMSASATQGGHDKLAPFYGSRYRNLHT